MNRVTLVRAGIIGAAPHRYIDVFLDERVSEFEYFYFDTEEEGFKWLMYLYNQDQSIRGNLYGRRFLISAFFRKYLTSIKTFDELISLIPSAMMYTITNKLTRGDLLIVGDNDFDTSFILASVLCSLGIPYVLTFKETRFIKNDLFEKLALEGAQLVVVPHSGYLNFIKKKHNLDISNKAIFADVDWRSKYVYEKYLKGSDFAKLSKIDGKKHICILTGRAVWDENESRSRGRYYYLDIIKKLVKAGFVVHLRTKYIIKSLDDPIFTPANPYYDLAKSYSKNFIIEDPINLNSVEGYFELMKYDYGLLSSGSPFPENFLEFEQYNIPNRYYEYKMAGVIPICPKGSLKYMEENIPDVIFFNEPSEIIEKSKHMVNVQPKEFYVDLIRGILNAYL